MTDDTSTALIRIGTRGSRLALVQAEEVRARLLAAHDVLRRPGSVSIVTVTTTGDRIRDRALADIGGKGLFCKEIEQALLDGRIDAAVHSMKDMETALAPGTGIAAILPREDPRDAFLSHRAGDVESLPSGAVIGTSSVRRSALLRHRRPDLRTVLFRGNVETRLRKLDEGVVDATVLALAGLRRLGLERRITRILSLHDMPPAVAQGAIGVQCRTGDRAVTDWLAAISHAASETEVRAERAMLAELDGSCRTPVSGHATLIGTGRIRLVGCCVAGQPGRICREQRIGDAADPDRLGREVGAALRRAAGSDLPR